MKKILLTLSIIIVSAMTFAQTITNSTEGMAYTLNPYAYDLSSTWNAETQQLTVNFMLNAVPNLDGVTVNASHTTEPNGIQIYAVDTKGNEYRIAGPSRQNIYDAGKGLGPYKMTIDLSDATATDGTPLPTGEELTWKVVVKGRDNAGRPSPELISARPTNFKRPRHMMGVAVGTNPLAPNFGKMFITEAADGTDSKDHATFGWLYDALYLQGYTAANSANKERMPALLEFTPQLLYKAAHRKHMDSERPTGGSYFSATMFTEPHRVKISEDGRIFVSSYHPSAAAAVMEYMGNHTFRTIILCDKAANTDSENAWKYNRRVIDFDVKGSGDDLKILVAWVQPKGTKNANNQWYAKVECIEYNVGKNTNIPQAQGTTLAIYNDYNADATKAGYLYQGFFGKGNNLEGDANFLTDMYTSGRVGLVNVAYGKGNNNPIWMKVDFAFAKTFQSQILYFDNTKQDKTYKNIHHVAQDYNINSGYYGGSAFAVTDNQLITASGNGKILVYNINAGKLSDTPTEVQTSYTNTSWVNGFTIDYANNVYAVSEYAGNIFTVALPYSGAIATPAPAGNTFTLPNPIPPVANILATDLKQTYDEEAQTFTFSFIANEQPTEGEIRFYTTANATTPEETVAIPLLSKGSNTITIPSADIPQKECYWRVYLKAEASEVFAPIYTQTAAVDPTRTHAAVNTYPETDYFGHIYLANHHNIVEATSRKHSVSDFALNQDGEYALMSNNPTTLHFTRRPAVAPDGMVYLVDEGTAKRDANGYLVNGPADFDNAGLWLLNPADAASGNATLTPFLGEGNYEATSAVAFYGKGANTLLYKTNTYDEFTTHGGAANGPTDNGYAVYQIGKANQSLLHTAPANRTVVPITGDAGGNFSIAPTAQGVWLCLHRDIQPTVAEADNFENIILSCYNHKGARVFASLDNPGNFHNYVQAAPGGAMTISADEQYLYMVNHDGDIVKFQITWGVSTPAGMQKRISLDQDPTPSLKYVETYATNYKAISSLAIDYAGNIIATAGEKYGNNGTIRDSQQLVVYTLPKADNQIEVPAPVSQTIPSREQNDGEDDDDVTTSIDMMEQDNNSTTEKLIHNGQLYIQRGNTIYSVLGDIVK